MDYHTYALNNLSDWLNDALQSCTPNEVVDTIHKTLDDVISYHDTCADDARKVRVQLAKQADPYAPYADNLDFDYELGNFGANLFITSPITPNSTDSIKF